MVAVIVFSLGRAKPLFGVWGGGESEKGSRESNVLHFPVGEGGRVGGRGRV